MITCFGAGGICSNLVQDVASLARFEFNVIDKDKVSPRNLMTSGPYYRSDIGQYKCKVLKKRVFEKNPDISVNAFVMWDYEIDDELIDHSDLIVIGVDSNAARQRINALNFSRPEPKPIVNLGFDGWDAAYTLFVPHVTSCWSCLFRPQTEEETQEMKRRRQCPQPEPSVPGGVLKGTIDQLVGFAANQILNWFVKYGPVVQYFAFNAKTGERELRFLDSENHLHPDSDCPVCQRELMKDVRAV